MVWPAWLNLIFENKLVWGRRWCNIVISETWDPQNIHFYCRISHMERAIFKTLVWYAPPTLFKKTHWKFTFQMNLGLLHFGPKTTLGCPLGPHGCLLDPLGCPLLWGGGGMVAKPFNFRNYSHQLSFKKRNVTSHLNILTKLRRQKQNLNHNSVK